MSYPDEVAAALEEIGAEEGDRVRVTTDEATYEGRVMPHHAFSDGDVLTVKLDSGYNVGVAVDAAELELLESVETERPSARAVETGEGPPVKILGTGGTIASFVDYRTGAVYPALEADELVASVPELADVAAVDAEVVFSIFSEDMDADHWEELADRVADAFDEGARGVVVPHGTDTMGYTAAALSFQLRDLPGPVCLVGAQRSSDRPSTDADMNLLAAARVAAEADLGEVCVVMHEETGDTRAAIHRGTRVRKCHTSRRDAFRSINAPLLGVVGDGDVEMLSDHAPASDGPVERRIGIVDDVRMVTYHPGMTEAAFRAATEGASGVVVQGTGLGHVGSHLVEAIEELTDDGVPVVMTSQCLWGRTNMRVYSNGRDLLDAGAIEAGDMLPETAYVKLAWLLGQGVEPAEVPERIGRSEVGETAERTPIEDPSR